MAFIPALPDTGSTTSVLTTGTVTILKQHTPADMGNNEHWEIKIVPLYRVRLADGSVTMSSQRVIAEVMLITRMGRCTLLRVRFNIIPGPGGTLLLGQPKLRRMGTPPMWKTIEGAIRYGGETTRPHTAKQALLKDWKRRRNIQEQDESDCIKQVDSLYGHGGVEPSESETLGLIKEIVDRASKASASDDFVKKYHTLSW